MSSAAPYFSIVTATFNAERVLAGLVRSVLTQVEPSWEWIVQDGASTDGTVAVLERIGDDRVRVESTTDSGIYEGLNRAIARSRGQYVVVLGADDELADPTVLGEIRARVERASRSPAVVLGSAQMGTATVFRSTLGLKTLVVNTVHHQGAAYARTEFTDFHFDEKARVVADYEHSLLLFLRRAVALQIPLLIARCGDTGVSRTSDERALYREMHLLRSKHLPRALSKALEMMGRTNVARRHLQHRIRGRRG